MPRISQLEPEQAEASAKRIMENLQKQFGVVIPPVKALAHKPDFLRSLLGLTTVADGPGEIDVGFKEVLNIRASVLNGCHFCTNMHANMARMHGVSPEKGKAAQEGSASDLFDEKEKAALRLCEESTQGVVVSEETFQNLQAHYSEKEIVELLGVVALINAWNRLIVGMGF